jgi:hypothetical protein
MRHDRHSMLIKFWLRASCLGLRARVEHDDDADKIYATLVSKRPKDTSS